MATLLMRRFQLPVILTAVLCTLVQPLGAQNPSKAPSSLELARAVEQVLVDAIAKAEKSVVAVASVRKELPGESFQFELRPDAFGRRTFPAPSPAPTDPDFIPNEFGTGVVIDRQGLILTAYHVLGAQSEYFITTHDRKVYRAWIKGADSRSDLAVLAIDAVDLVPIVLGDAADLKKGHMVIALGNPYGIARDGQPSASWGVVSNLARKAPLAPAGTEPTGKATLHHFGTLIQTDAKLNLGTSGGPLLNLDGRMVGLTTALAATAGYEQAAGYAYPVDDTFRRVVQQLSQGREVEYGYLGVQPMNLSAEETLKGLRGVRIERVVAGTPADRFGLKAGDLITRVDDAPVHDADSLVLEVGKLPVESVVQLDLIRDSRRLNLDVALTKFPIRGEKVVTVPPPAWRGMRIDYASAGSQSDSPTSGPAPAFDDGVLVTEVEEGTPAWQAGLRPGMLVRQVDRATVRSPKDFRSAIASKSGTVQLRLAGNAADHSPLNVAPGS
ncbi:MAG: PDZ domain-containing protein [Rhodopirellula sp.]|nr:PDZ domain-containing protein [Rhodopirellula sp.]